MSERVEKWSTDNENKLRTLWTNGITVAVIAEKLTSTVGAIASKVRRLKLPPRSRGYISSTRKITKEKERAPQYAPIETHPLPGTTPVSLLDINNN